MDRDNQKLMTPFDCQTIPQWLYVLKLLLPYTPRKHQQMLAIFIRLQEMQFTLNHFSGFHTNKKFDCIFNDVKPYMDSSTREMMEHMESMLSMMEVVQMMNENSSENPDDFNLANMFSDLFFMKGNANNE